MIKFIKTEGKTGQEVQGYIDSCVNNGANPYECVVGTNQEHNYDLEHSIENFKYAGVDVDGDTLLSNDLGCFSEFDIGRLLEIKEAASEVFNNLEYDARNEKLNEAVEALRELLS